MAHFSVMRLFALICSFLACGCTSDALSIPVVRPGAASVMRLGHKPLLAPDSRLRLRARCARQRMEADDDPEPELVAAAGPADEPSALSIMSVLLAAFLNLLGYTMTIPLGAALKNHFALPMGASFGLISSAYPLGTLGAYFLWPQLSDRVGRKPVISLSLLGSGIGLALQCLALTQGRSLQFFLGCKVFTGFCAGAGPVAKAYLADVGSTAGSLPKFMAWRDAANTLAFIMGPLIGGKLFMASGSLAAVIGATAATSLFAALLTGLFMAEVEAPKGSAKGGANDGKAAAKNGKAAAPLENTDGFVACPLGSQLWTAVASVCVITALYNCGSATFNAVFAPLAQDLAGLDAGKIGLAYTLLASLSFAVSTTTSAAVQRRLGTVTTCCLGLSCVRLWRPPTLHSLSLTLCAMPILTLCTTVPFRCTCACTCYMQVGLGLSLVSLVAFLGGNLGGMLPPALLLTFWLAAAIYQVGVPLYTPTIPTMLLQCAPRHRRGALMGLDEACNTVARVCAPPFFLSLIATHGLSACTSAAALAVFLGVLVAAFRRWIVLRKSYAPVR